MALYLWGADETCVSEKINDIDQERPYLRSIETRRIRMKRWQTSANSRYPLRPPCDRIESAPEYAASLAGKRNHSDGGSLSRRKITTARTRLVDGRASGAQTRYSC
jgi:hypothetical protein